LSPPFTVRVLLAFSHARAWRGAGVLSALVAFLILSYYSVIGGWACRYFVSYVNGTLPRRPPMAARALACTVHGADDAGGGGRRRARHRAASRILLPVLAAMVILLAGYALSLPGASRGLAFLFTPDRSALATPHLYLAALRWGTTGRC
jgi:NSS family neurotransmitter:Na+ symporter